MIVSVLIAAPFALLLAALTLPGAVLHRHGDREPAPPEPARPEGRPSMHEPSPYGSYGGVKVGQPDREGT